MPSQEIVVAPNKVKPSAIPGLVYEIASYPGDTGFIVIHRQSGLSVVRIIGAKRPATDFVRWADYSLTGPDWRAHFDEIAGARHVIAAAVRFKSGLENVGPKWKDVIQVKPDALAMASATMAR